MTAEEVHDLYKSLDQGGILVWLDGGWAVDALLGEQTRPHQDLDLAVQHKDMEALKMFLATKGFIQITRNEEDMWDLVLANDKGTEIEVHAFNFNDSGGVVEEEYWNGYSAHSVTGKGKILDTEVRCVSLEQLVKTHDKSRRVLKTTDLQDMTLLGERFGVKFP